MANSDEKDEKRRRMADRGLNRMLHIGGALNRVTQIRGHGHSQSVSSLPPADNSSLPPVDNQTKFNADAKLLESSDAESGDEKRKVERALKRKPHIANLPFDNQALYDQPPSDQITAIPEGVEEHETWKENFPNVGGQAAEPKVKKYRLEAVQKPSRIQPDHFCSKQLNACIIASERTRAIYVLVIAVFVVGMNIIGLKSIAVLRPAFIMLLTEITVVLSLLLLDKKEEFDQEGSENNRQESFGAANVLMRGLVIYQTVQAIFTDFSIYAVVIICGLSLL